jgi:TonB family protein
MFTQPTQIPRTPLASTLTIVFHVCLGLAVVLVTALPSIPRDHKSESLTYMVVVPPPADLRFDVPKITPPPTPPKLELPKPEPVKAFEAPFIPKPVPPPPPPPPPAPEKRAIEPPREIPIPKPPVNVGAFADATTVTRKERVADVAKVDFAASTSESARLKREVHDIHGFDGATARSSAAKPTVADAGFGATAANQNAPRAALTATNAGFGAEITTKPAPTAPRAPSAAGVGVDVTAKPAAATPKPPAQTTGFADAPQTPRPAPQAPPPPPRADRPVEVVYKPTPNYTEEARAQHIEGEVTLEVEFTAAGQVRVVRVVRGLGHGLDEMAQRAAEQIRFKPATSKGTPVDFRANLTILFRLT